MSKQYKGFKAINYVVAIKNAENVAMIDPLSFMLGRIRVARRPALRKMVSNWRTAKGEDYQSPFPDRTTMLLVKEDGEWVRRKRDLTDLSDTEIIYNLEQQVRRAHDTYNFLRIGGDRVFQDWDIGSDGEPAGTAYAGQITLSGRVRRRGLARTKGRDGRRHNRDRFIDVSIKGPFETSKIKLANILADDSEFDRVGSKHGYKNAQFVTPEVAALLYYARHHPDAIGNLKKLLGKRNTQIWTPFHAYQPNNINRDALVIDSLVESLSTRKGTTKFDINKVLMDRNELYDPLLEEMLYQGDASYGAVQSKWILDRINPKVPREQLQWYDAMQRHLEAKGYKISGLVIEKKGSEHEMVALEYLHKSGDFSARLLFFEGLPPLVMLRQYSERFATKVFEKPKSAQHPYAELFTPKSTFDDATRKYTNSEILLSPQAARTQDGRMATNEAMIPHYAEGIAQHFPGGLDGFRRKMYGRKSNIPNGNLVNLGLGNLIAKK